MNNHPAEFCITCLVRVGYGIKRISKILKVSKSSVFRAKQRYGLGDVKAERPVTVGRFQPLPAYEAYCKYWMNEELSVKESDYPDWWNHIERLRLVGRLNARKQWRLMKSENRPQRIAKKLRHHIWKHIRNYKKDSSSQLIGCTWLELQVKLQNQFDIGMTWENMGMHWHIDHIKPCASFDLTKESEQRKCFHWSNLRPLPARENIRKHSWYKGKHYKTRRRISSTQG